MKTPAELHTATDFLQFFEAIPEEKWCVGKYRDSEGRSCAYGHLGIGVDDAGDEATAPISSRINRYLGWHTHEINDGRYPGHTEPTPKARICAALRDAIAKGK